MCCIYVVNGQNQLSWYCGKGTDSHSGGLRFEPGPGDWLSRFSQSLQATSVLLSQGKLWALPSASFSSHHTIQDCVTALLNNPITKSGTDACTRVTGKSQDVGDNVKQLDSDRDSICYFGISNSSIDLISKNLKLFFPRSWSTTPAFGLFGHSVQQVHGL